MNRLIDELDGLPAEFRHLLDSESKFKDMVKEDWKAVYKNIYSGKNDYQIFYRAIITGFYDSQK